jgi:iron complex outermembrane recepter protein
MPRLSLLTTVAAIAVCQPLVANAQAAGAQGAGGSTVTEPSAGALAGEIVVTARRREENISKVPIAITAFSGEALDRKGVTSTADLVKITPGLNIAPGGTRTNPFVTIRGQTKAITGNIQPGVITYVNEVPLANQGSLIPTYDIQNIQVLKGPQGTLFGRNSMGGAILVNTREPGYQPGGYAKADIAQHNYWQFEGAVNIPIVADRVALRVAAQIYHDGGSVKSGYVTPYTVDPVTGLATPGTFAHAKYDLDELSGRSIRASLRLDPTDNIKNVTAVEYSKVRGLAATPVDRFFPNGFPDGATPAIYLRTPAQLAALVAARGITAPYAQNVLRLAQCGGGNLVCDQPTVAAYFAANRRAAIANTDPWYARTVLFGLTNTTTLNLSEQATLKNIIGYRTTDAYTDLDTDNTPLMLGAAPSQANLEQFTDELQLSGDLMDRKLHYTLGAFYYREQPNGLGGQSANEINAQFGLTHSQSDTYLRTTSKALYGQFDYSLDDVVEGLTFTAGARQTWDAVHGCTAAVTYAATATPLLVTRANSPYLLSEDQCKNYASTSAAGRAAILASLGASGVSPTILPKAKFDQLTYTIGLNWQINPGTMIYGVRRRGYRSGNYNTPTFDPFLASLQAFQPETLDDWEAGAKLRWSRGGAAGSLDVAVFTGKDKNYQLAVNTSNLTAACVPEAISPSRPSDCVNAFSGASGVRVAHAAPTTIANAGELTIRGFEVGATLSPLQGLTLGAAVSYVDYAVDKIELNANLNALLRAGNVAAPTTIVLNQQPKWTYNLDATYMLPQKVLNSDLSFDANLKHSEHFDMFPITVPGYTVVDARITLANIGGTNLDLSAYVKNLTNKFYRSGAASYTPGSGGFQSFILGAPRTFGLSVRYDFGA